MKKFYVKDNLTQTVLVGPFDDREKALEAYENAKKEFPDAHVVMVEHEPETTPTPSQEQNEKKILHKKRNNVAETERSSFLIWGGGGGGGFF